MTVSLGLIVLSALASYPTGPMDKSHIQRGQSSLHPEWVTHLSASERLQRASLIRDAAAQVGLHNGALLAGIAQVETGFAHCWSEATWACEGPPSASCEDGPVISGAADGPCEDLQGGLGMFQFDAGTHADTIAEYGPDIVTIAGNVGAVVPFLLTRAVESVDGIDTQEQALAWMNGIPIVAEDPQFVEWIYFVSWRYNGCKGCEEQQDKYRDGTLLVAEEFGANFWQSSQSCEAVIADSVTVLDDSDPCVQVLGPPKYWRYESDKGVNGAGLFWTNAFMSEESSNWARWNLNFAAAGEYKLEVYLEPEYSVYKAARYELLHNGWSTDMIVDQSQGNGWYSLGTFEFAKGEGQRLALFDNSLLEVDADQHISVDAIRLTSVEPPAPEDSDSDSEGCNGGGNSSLGGAWLLVLFFSRGWLRTTHSDQTGQ